MKAKTKEAKPTILNTLFLNLQTSVEECEAIIKAFEEYGYTTYYDAKTKMLKTSAPKTKIKELSKEFKSIQSYDIFDRNPNNEDHFLRHYEGSQEPVIISAFKEPLK